MSAEVPLYLVIQFKENLNSFAAVDGQCRFIIQYSQIREEAERIGAKIFFVDEAHFRADADLRGK